MKIVNRFILSLICNLMVMGESEMFNGSVCAYDSSGNPLYVGFNPLDKTFTTNRLEVFNTHNIGLNTFEVTTDKDQSVNLLLANNTYIKVMPGSEFRIDGFNINLNNPQPYPTKIEIDNYNLNLALMSGEAFFITEKSNTFDQLLLQTPISNIGLGTGRYHVTVDKTTVLIYILDGSLDVYDNVTNKKENIRSGNVVLIHPAPKLSPQRLQIFSDKMITSVKKTKKEDTDPLTEVLRGMEVIKDQVIFINIQSNITAVKIK